MPEPYVLVVAETPSLAHAISDLLETEGHRVATVPDPGRTLTRRLRRATAPIRLVICASNGHHCATAGRWKDGDVDGIDLVIVGSRDPGLRSSPRVHVVPLPLRPDAFLELVHGLVERPRAPAPHGRDRPS